MPPKPYGWKVKLDEASFRPSESDFDLPDTFALTAEDELERMAEEMIESEKAEALLEMSEMELDKEVQYVKENLDWIDGFLNAVSEKAMGLSERVQKLEEETIEVSELKDIIHDVELLKMQLSKTSRALQATGVVDYEPDI